MSVLCLNDFSILKRIGEKRAKVVGKKTPIEVPIYECPMCKGKYTLVDNCREYVTIRIEGTNYVNISPSRNRKRCIKASIPIEERQENTLKERKKSGEKSKKRQKAKAVNEGRIEFWNPENQEVGKNKHLLYVFDNNIRAKDFLIRRTTFKCLYKEHELRNIQGNIDIIDKDGNVKQVSVPAGYCSNCNLFFIMESTYQILKSKGIPMCRISDEKTYLQNAFSANGMRLAKESVLMQYGYSVSKEEGLTTHQRRKILANLVDLRILTRSDIIGYLDFFISQRKSQPKYEKAIEKWERDQEFISEYRAGDYAQYGISGIYRKG